MPTVEKPKPAVKRPRWLNFLFGGCAGMSAICVVQPLDLIKTRMQLQGLGGQPREYNTSFQAARGIVKKEGAFGFYTGLSAALVRQITYTTTRLGVFQWLVDNFTVGGVPPNFAMKAAMGVVAGGTAGFVGTPTEVALIRMTADGRLPPSERRNYKHVIDAFIRIVKEDGIVGCWRGAVPTIGRAMVVSAAQLSTYSQAKEVLLESGHFQDNIFLYFCSSMISGLVTTTASLPVDIAKTRIQNMLIVDGKPEYSGTFDVLAKIIKREGVLALWKGFTPYYGKVGPNTVLIFLFLEKFNYLYKKYYMDQ